MSNKLPTRRSQRVVDRTALESQRSSETSESTTLPPPTKKHKQNRKQARQSYSSLKPKRSSPYGLLRPLAGLPMAPILPPPAPNLLFPQVPDPPSLPIFPPLRPTNVHFPQEVWIKIWSYVVGPRVLTIEASPKYVKTLQVASGIERFPSAIFMTMTAWNEALKTHRIAFKSMLGESALFNPKEDVFHFKGPRELSIFIDIPNCIDLARNEPLKFVGLTINPDACSPRDLGENLVKVARLFGNISKLVIVLPGKDTVNARAIQESILSIMGARYESAKAFWAGFEVKGFLMNNKWTAPEIVFVNTEREMLGSFEG